MRLQYSNKEMRLLLVWIHSTPVGQYDASLVRIQPYTILARKAEGVGVCSQHATTVMGKRTKTMAGAFESEAQVHKTIPSPPYQCMEAVEI